MLHNDSLGIGRDNQFRTAGTGRVSHPGLAFDEYQVRRRLTGTFNDGMFEFTADEIIERGVENEPVLVSLQPSGLTGVDHFKEFYRPPLAGVIREFEEVPEIHAFLSGDDAHNTTRFRQAVGVLVKMHMEQEGWSTTGRKGSLGTRAKTAPGSTKPGAYQNKSGLSKWFTRCERYQRRS